LVSTKRAEPSARSHPSGWRYSLRSTPFLACPCGFLPAGHVTNIIAINHDVKRKTTIDRNFFRG
jgi:hypothetical protein